MAKKKQVANSKNSKVEDKMKDLTSINNPMITGIYGRSGTGKTTILSTFPKPILLIDVKDKGTESAKYDDLEDGDIMVYEVEDFDEFEELYGWLYDGGYKKFKTVGIDHMTAAQELSHEKTMEEENKTKMSQQLYGFSSSKLKELIARHKGLADLGIEPVFLIQDRQENGEGEGEDQLTPEVGPAIMPSVAKLLCAACRVVGHSYIQEKVEKEGVKTKRSIEYRLRLGPNPYYITKVTKPKGYDCPMYIVDPTYKDIVDVVKGKYGKDKPKPDKKIKKKLK